MPGAPATGDEGESSYPQSRRSSSQLPLSPYREVHNRLPRLFSGHVPGVRSRADAGDDDGSSSDNDEPGDGENFLGRVQSYSKLMHAHSEAQLRRPSISTLPSYARTMHAHTMNQLSHHHKLATQSATNSPQLGIGGRTMMLPRQVCTELSRLSMEEVPNPSNTPEVSHQGADARWVRKRSVTEPVSGVFAGSVTRKDFAVT
ncbi:hypothetical protein B0A55_02074 [Friedmanniomyces simplex]|uniref:Uncharacterized protein n=1 Tax=Friedmanniomyces simplex TaxID=329884 RepID=A0A4U0Y072_9PEZI|nr:hypothetical protein B0A55_02074 [Friedmanniomyces simplex]